MGAERAAKPGSVRPGAQALPPTAPVIAAGTAPAAGVLLGLQRSVGNRAVVGLIGRPGRDGAVRRKLVVGGTPVLQNNLKEELAKDRATSQVATSDTMAHKFQDWANDGEERDLTNWAAARVRAAAEMEVDQIVYTALLNLAVAGPGTLVQEDETGTGPDNARSVIDGLLAAQGRYRAACRPSANNVFAFAGSEFFVDQDANYIYPRNEVNKQGVLKDRPTWAKDRNLGAKFSYPEHQLPRKTVIEILNAVAAGAEDALAVGDDLLCLFLASFVAEPGRNPVANITNLMIYAGVMDQGTGKTARDNVFDVMPMTKGGTAKPTDKLGAYDQAMATRRSGASGIVVAPKATSEEIRMVLRAFGAKLTEQLTSMVAKGEQAKATALLQERLRGLIVAGTGTLGKGIPKEAKTKGPTQAASTPEKEGGAARERPSEGSTPSEITTGEATPRRQGGDCLYDAVNDASGNQYDNVEAYRAIAHGWFLENVHVYPDLTEVADFDEIVRTLKTPRAWTGDAGDLSPLILASSLGITLEIVSVGATHVYEPLGGHPLRTVRVFYAADHYTDAPTGSHAGWDSQETVVHRGKPAASSTPPEKGDREEGGTEKGGTDPGSEKAGSYRSPVYFGLAEIPTRFSIAVEDLKADQVYPDSDGRTRYRYLGVRPSVFTLKTHAFERVDELV